MFLKGQRESTSISVTAECPHDGAIQKITFKARYRLPPHSEARQLVEDATGGDKNDDDVVRALLTGWEGMKDADNEPVDYSPEMRDEVLDFPPYRAALVKGAMQVLFGKDIMRRKNSRTPGGRG